MRVALIPPTPDLHRLPRTGIHLLLSHLFDQDGYLEYYQARRDAGDYLILDNSAHEHGIGEREESLLRKATELNAQEVVVPDVLFDRRGTVEQMKRFMKFLTSPRGSQVYVDAGYPRLMIVPQAEIRNEWGMCLRAMLSAWDMFTSKMTMPLESPVIGISKDYENWRGGLQRLIRDFVAPIYDERDFDVHLLGWANNLWATAAIAEEFPWIRSTDSAKPFVFAKSGIKLEPGGKIPAYPRRDPEYFQEPLLEWQWRIALVNIEVYKAASENDLV